MAVEVPKFIKCGDKIPEDFDPVDIKRLLTLHNQGQTEVVPVSFDAIEGTFTQETGLGLPYFLIQDLGFTNLRWRMVHHPQSVSTLWIGQREPSGSFKEAQATIYFAKYIDYSKTEDGSQSLYPDTVYPSSLSLASIGQGERPAVYTQYSLSYYADHLLCANIPLPEEDLQILKRTALDQQSALPEKRALNIFNSSFPDFVSSTDGSVSETIIRLTNNLGSKCLNIRRVEAKSTETYNHYDFDPSQRAYLEAYGLHVSNYPWLYYSNHQDLRLIYRYKGNDILLIRIDPKLLRRFSPNYPYYE